MNYPILFLIIANVIWGAAIPIFKYSLDNIPPFTFLFIRSFGAALIFLPATFICHVKLSRRDYFHVLLATLTGVTIPIGFLYLGLQRAPSINFSLIVSISPLLLYFGAIILLKERAHNRIVLGGLVALIGVLFVILYPIIVDGKYETGEFYGNMLFLIAVIANIANVLIVKKTLEHINIFSLMFYMFGLTALVICPLVFIELQHWSYSELTHVGLIGIIYGTIFSSAVAYYLYHWAIPKIEAQEVGIFSYAQPIVAIIVAVPLLHEIPMPHFYIGAALVIAGILLAEHHIRKKRRTHV